MGENHLCHIFLLSCLSISCRVFTSIKNLPTPPCILILTYTRTPGFLILGLLSFSLVTLISSLPRLILTELLLLLVSLNRLS
ncbi:hypothetical protein L1887_18826 [Cichorium endivia]|nr:hypothetical protein L1887_18826 [Cichorium endivia]